MTTNTPHELTEAEDVLLADWWVSQGGDYEDLAIESLTDVVERILTDRCASPAPASATQECPSACGRNEPCPNPWHDRRPEVQR